jgi:hypothetical protein
MRFGAGREKAVMSQFNAMSWTTPAPIQAAIPSSTRKISLSG